MKKIVSLSMLILVIAVFTGISRAGDTEYRNIMNMEKFVDSSKDTRDTEYKNIITLEMFVSALKDPCHKNNSVELVLSVHVRC